TVKAAKKYKCRTIALGGGVAANSLLRQAMAASAGAEMIETLLPPRNLCTDNAAMVGACAYFQARTKRLSSLSLQAVASLKLV
ncbi:MAG: tRNA (adenosine(37)-N6)-threonylcarbamoyltransferase complex transferase subunit TsaD, partial [Candidatus Saganbacteria bacterium]|nr:tRNA (adenosine(37)-N6)-threonylcarbamoyltransferase complex transferase subunit TsaD [Candidatus Saganbacteria bacterium]